MTGYISPLVLGSLSIPSRGAHLECKDPIKLLIVEEICGLFPGIVGKLVVIEEYPFANFGLISQVLLENIEAIKI